MEAEPAVASQRMSKPPAGSIRFFNGLANLTGLSLGAVPFLSRVSAPSGLVKIDLLFLGRKPFASLDSVWPAHPIAYEIIVHPGIELRQLPA
jgi:hypothetical protein